jgi:hypothetical protein
MARLQICLFKLSYEMCVQVQLVKISSKIKLKLEFIENAIQAKLGLT